MNRWAMALAQTPPTLQRLIAATQRVSLPRGCSPAERLQRLRSALCRRAAVHAVYFSLSEAEQQALQELRHVRRGFAPAQLAARFGPIRPLAALRADRTPRTLSERLLLLGWLLPRPAARNHPPRYLLPAEVRAWLPVPLPALPATAPSWPTMPDPAALPALTAATAILLASAEQPLPLRRDGQPAARALHALQPRLTPLPPAETDALLRWLLPLLIDLGLLAPHGSAVVPAPAARRFLNAPAAERLHMLRAAWVRAPRGERWLRSLRVSTRGLDWPALRRRLLAWAEALPPAAAADPATGYALLHAALGPLADACTHGLRPSLRRSPWLPRRAVAVWAAACAGPLAWLGALPASPAAPSSGSGPRSTLPTPEATWQVDPMGMLSVPRTADPGDLLTLAPFARWSHQAGDCDVFTLSRAALAAATSRGHDPARLRALLARRGTALPDALAAALAPSDGMRLLARTVLISDQPEDLARALRQRSTRRAVEAHLAPGVALVAPGREAALTRALARAGRTVAAPPPAASTPPAGFTPAEQAALLLACAHYRACPPAFAPPGPRDELLARLRSGLPPALAAATDAALAALSPAASVASPPPPDPHPAPAPTALPSLASLLATLRVAAQRRRAVTLHYQGRDESTPRARIVRPLRLERHGPWWYLYAYCLQARAERCFRLDRVQYAALLDTRPDVGARPSAATSPSRRQRPARSALHSAADPPDPPAVSPVVRIWLVDEQGAL